MQIKERWQESYYRGLNCNSKESNDLPLIANCAGKVHISSPFVTYNAIGRLDYYLIYLTEGKMKVRLGEEDRVIRAGEFVIFPPGYKYRYELEQSSKMSYSFVHFTGSHAAEYLERLKMKDNPTVRRANSGEELSLAFSSFFIDYDSSSDFRDVALCSGLSRILVLLAKAYHRGGALSVSKSLSYINENYTKDIRIPDLAAIEGLSVSRYNFLFKEAVGVSPVRYITGLRMRQARILLESTKIPVKQIGQTVGYPDNHFFSKLFKGWVGVSPNSYRKGVKDG